MSSQDWNNSQSSKVTGSEHIKFQAIQWSNNSATIYHSKTIITTIHILCTRYCTHQHNAACVSPKMAKQPLQGISQSF